MDLLKKSLAPITDQAWEEINDQAIRVFKSVLTARRYVDVDGPKGAAYAAEPVGRLQVDNDQGGREVRYGIHQVLPLIESRVDFELDLWEIDNIERGAEDIDLGEMEKAAKKITEFEEKVIYEGFDKSCVKGLKQSTAHNKLALPDDPDELLRIVAQSVAMFTEAAVEGPFDLIVPTDKWKKIFDLRAGYPLIRHLENLIGGKVVLNTHISDSYMVSKRGGDFKLTLGQDLSIGYDTHDAKKVKLYFTESFTFRVLDPNAVIVFE